MVLYNCGLISIRCRGESKVKQKIQIRAIDLKLMIFLFCVGCHMSYQTTPLAETLITLVT